MTVTITLQKPDGSILTKFLAEDRQSLAQLVKNNGIEFPTSCGIGACGICKCKIISGHQHIQIDKISTPMRPLERDEKGVFQEVFACVGGITSESIKDAMPYEVILEKNM